MGRIGALPEAVISAYPLCWPDGWPRMPSHHRIGARFTKGERQYSSTPGVSASMRYHGLTVSDGVNRILRELERVGVIDRRDVVVSTNVRTKLDGFPRSGEPAPDDPGAAVYWEDPINGKPRVIAVDRYDSVAGNLGAIAATLDAMRAIERHGGAQILERAFTGFTALPNPANKRTWRDVFGYAAHERPTPDDLRTRYRVLAQSRHPDRGGSESAMAEINVAKQEAEQAIGAP